MESIDLLRKIDESYLRAVRARSNLILSGPFIISLNPATPLRWLNNASVNDPNHTISKTDVDAMVRTFEEHDRMPRMELIRELRKDLVELLINAGFEIESELPIMVATAETFKPQINPTVSVEFLTPVSDPTPFMRVADAAFDHEEPITPARIEGMRQSLRKGSQWAALATIENKPAAVASLVVSDSVAELAGVGTLAEFRRRGAASTASSRLLEEFFKHGELVWLSAGDDTAKAVYEKLGFKVLGVQVNISKPPAQEISL